MGRAFLMLAPAALAYAMVTTETEFYYHKDEYQSLRDLLDADEVACVDISVRAFLGGGGAAAARTHAPRACARRPFAPMPRLPRRPSLACGNRQPASGPVHIWSDLPTRAQIPGAVITPFGILVALLTSFRLNNATPA